MREPDWQCEGVDLYLGDCLEILPELPAGSIDAVVTDPPYGLKNAFPVQNKLNGRRVLSFDWDGPDVDEKVEAALTSAFRVTCHPCAAFVFCGFEQPFVAQVMRAAGLIVKPAVWLKTCPPPALPGNWWPSGFELAAYGYEIGAWFGDRDKARSNVFVADSYRHGQPGKVAHPTQKPLTILRRIVASIVCPGGACLDCFMGSGTTGIACVETGRQFVGIEIEPRYFEIAVQRIDAARRQGRLPFGEPVSVCSAVEGS